MFCPPMKIFSVLHCPEFRCSYNIFCIPWNCYFNIGWVPQYSLTMQRFQDLKKVVENHCSCNSIWEICSYRVKFVFVVPDVVVVVLGHVVDVRVELVPRAGQNLSTRNHFCRIWQKNESKENWRIANIHWKLYFFWNSSTHFTSWSSKSYA